MDNTFVQSSAFAIFFTTFLPMLCAHATRVKTHYNDPLWGTFWSSTIVHTIELFQKYGTFKFGYQFWFLGPNCLMLCNFFLNKKKNHCLY